jgi:hypothetical protein
MHVFNICFINFTEILCFLLFTDIIGLKYFLISVSFEGGRVIFSAIFFIRISILKLLDDLGLLIIFFDSGLLKMLYLGKNSILSMTF